MVRSASGGEHRAGEHFGGCSKAAGTPLTSPLRRAARSPNPERPTRRPALQAHPTANFFGTSMWMRSDSIRHQITNFASGNSSNRHISSTGGSRMIWIPFRAAYSSKSASSRAGASTTAICDNGRRSSMNGYGPSASAIIPVNYHLFQKVGKLPLGRCWSGNPCRSKASERTPRGILSVTAAVPCVAKVVERTEHNSVRSTASESGGNAPCCWRTRDQRRVFLKQGHKAWPQA
jgi:hypothetical protein